MSETISVIVPLYNNERYISRCLDSITGQSYENLQILVIDDGSTDEGAKIVQKHAACDSRISLHRLQHGGLCKARKYGVRHAAGEYVGFVDSDDWVEPEYYKKLYGAICQRADLAACGYTKEYASTSVRMPENCACGMYAPEKIEDLWETLLCPNETLSPILCTKLLRKCILEEVMCQADDRLRIGEDAVVSYTYMLECRMIAVIDECGYHYVCNPDSMTERSDDSFLEEVHIFYLNMLRNVKGHPLEKGIVENLRRYTVSMLRNRINYKLSLPVDVRVPSYYYPWYGRLEGRRVVLYGAGEVGREYYQRMLLDGECQVVLWCDQAYGLLNQKYSAFLKELYRYMPKDTDSCPCQFLRDGAAIQPVQRIADTEFDVLVIAVKEQQTAQAIRQELIVRYHIDNAKILWNKTVSKWETAGGARNGRCRK